MLELVVFPFPGDTVSCGPVVDVLAPIAGYGDT